MIAFPILFSFVLKWLDYEVSRRSIISLAHDAFNQPAVMWSPWATAQGGPVDDVWMRIIWKVLMKRDPPGLLVSSAARVAEAGASIAVGDGQEETSLEIPHLEVSENDQASKTIRLTCLNFAELSGREEMTENRLRTSQNRYLLHRSYASKAGGVF